MELARRIGEYEIKIISGKLSRVKKAELMLEKEKLEKELEKERNSTMKTVPKTLLELWNSFTEMCMEMSKAEGKMNWKEIESLNVTNFYQLKTWLQKKRTPTKSHEDS